MLSQKQISPQTKGDENAIDSNNLQERNSITLAEINMQSLTMKLHQEEPLAITRQACQDLCPKICQ